MSFYDIDLVTIDGKPQKMDVYRGKTLLIVNVASQCGFTPQRKRAPALQISEIREARHSRYRGDQVELHEVPCRFRRKGTQALCAERQARGDRGRRVSEAVVELVVFSHSFPNDSRRHGTSDRESKKGSEILHRRESSDIEVG